MFVTWPRLCRFVFCSIGMWLLRLNAFDCNSSIYIWYYMVWFLALLLQVVGFVLTSISKLECLKQELTTGMASRNVARQTNSALKNRKPKRLRLTALRRHEAFAWGIRMRLWDCPSSIELCWHLCTVEQMNLWDAVTCVSCTILQPCTQLVLILSRQRCIL